MSDDPLQDALDQLDALAAHDGRTVTVTQQGTPTTRGQISDAHARAMHTALLRLQRQSGSLGLNK